MQFWADFGQDALKDYYHVIIDGRSYFVGRLAEQQSNVRHFTLDQEKLINDFVKLMALTAAGVFVNPEAAVNVPINVVSGLPIGYFRKNHKRFHELLTGHHRIVYHEPDGSRLSKEIYVNKVKMLPQPLGTILNVLMDDKGRIINRDYARQKVGIVDIGFRTTDFTILDRLRYIDRGSRTMDTGVAKAFSVIANKLRERFGVSVELYRLYQAVESGSIQMRGQIYDLAPIRDQVYAELAEHIAGDLDRLWDEDWDIETIILTGGGAMDLAPHLQNLLPANVAPLDANVDARLNNVRGYVKYGGYIWGENQ
jgi:plasmid segregation protein ParM